MLAVTEVGADTDHPPVLIAHGLFGSARNWGTIAKRLSANRKVLTVDMRNHGVSPRFESNTYEDMASDLAEVIAAHGGVADVIGHSMGGKSGMVLAITRPDLVRQLVVADIAPVPYGHTQSHLIAAMKGVDLDGVASRGDADRQLKALVPDAPVRAFLLQSLDVAEKAWRLNLDVLDREMPEIMDFPDIAGCFDKETLFLSGGKSDYVREEHKDTILSFFPKALFKEIEGAGHWLHAERPKEFEVEVRQFLS